VVAVVTPSRGPGTSRCWALISSRPITGADRIQDEYLMPSGRVKDLTTPRNQARLAGAKTFDPGKPCPRGHRSLYNTRSGACIECVRALDNSPGYQARRRRHANTEHGQQWRKDWYAQNSGRCVGYVIKKFYGQDDRLILPEHKPIVAAMYADAHKRSLVVDHIIPFRGKYVSGLHILCNLQIITREENQKKLNYTESDSHG
jgi:hypothetical protein